MKFLRGHFLVHSLVHQGDFSLESDRESLRRVMELLLQKKLENMAP